MVASYHSPSLHPCARDGSSRCVTCATRPPLCTVHLDHIDHRMLRVVQSGATFIEAIHATAPNIYTTNEMTREIIECMSTLIAHCVPNFDDARAATTDILNSTHVSNPWSARRSSMPLEEHGRARGRGVRRVAMTGHSPRCPSRLVQRSQTTSPPLDGRSSVIDMRQSPRCTMR